MQTLAVYRKTHTIIHGLTPTTWEKMQKTLSPSQKKWALQCGFEAKAGQHCILPAEDGSVACVLWGWYEDPFFVATLASLLPKGTYCLDDAWQGEERKLAALAWLLEGYCFERYKSEKRPEPLAQLSIEQPIKDWAESWAKSVCLVRDLINTPTEDMNPDTLCEVASQLAKTHKGKCKVIKGDALLKKGYRAIHTVGRAGAHPPCLIDLTWGKKKYKRLTLVGKGVCFDTGGLDLKTPSGMREMKKDMGGSAHVLGLARHIMANNLPVQLRVLIPAVENNVSHNAYRPGDVITTYKGSTVEVDNTDAEGRLILSDALHLACEQGTDCLIDFATLTGAARIAMGPTLPAMFSNNDALANQLLQAGDALHDPMWRLPLHAPYKTMIESELADIKNTGGSPYGGAITAALFLEHFVDSKIPWVHFDIMAANLKGSPGKPKGGEAMALRSVYACIEQWADVSK